MINIIADDIAVAALNDTEKPLLYPRIKRIVRTYADRNLLNVSHQVDNDLQIRNIYLRGNVTGDRLIEFISYLERHIYPGDLTWIRKIEPDTTQQLSFWEKIKSYIPEVRLP